MDSSTTGYLSMLMAILGWGFSTSIIEVGLQDIPPFPFLFLRFFLTLVVMTPFIVPKKKERIVSLLKMKTTWLIGISESAGLLFQYLAFEYGVTAGLSSLLSLLFLVFVPFLSFVILRERIRLQHMFAVGIALLGVFIISTEGKPMELQGNSLSGVGLLLLSATSYGLYIVFTSKLSTRELEDVDVFALFYVVMGIISAFALSGTLIFDTLSSPPKQSWIWLFLIIFVSTILPFIGYFKASKTIPANLASILLLGQVIVPFSIDLIFLGRDYSSMVFFGIFIVAIAMVIAILTPTDEFSP